MDDIELKPLQQYKTDPVREANGRAFGTDPVVASSTSDLDHSLSTATDTAALPLSQKPSFASRVFEFVKSKLGFYILSFLIISLSLYTTDPAFLNTHDGEHSVFSYQKWLAFSLIFYLPIAYLIFKYKQ